MNKLVSRAVLAIALAVIASVPGSAQNDAQVNGARARLEANIPAIQFMLTLVDQVNRMAVAQGAMTAAAADAGLRAQAADLMVRNITQNDVAAMRNLHVQAADYWRGQITARMNQGAQWPAGGAQAWRPTADEMMNRVANELRGWLDRNMDPRPLVEDLATVDGWTRGRVVLDAANNPFAGQYQRVANAFADPRAGQLASAAMGLTPPEQAGQNAAGNLPPAQTLPRQPQPPAPQQPQINQPQIAQPQIAQPQMPQPRPIPGIIGGQQQPQIAQPQMPPFPPQAQVQGQPNVQGVFRELPPGLAPADLAAFFANIMGQAQQGQAQQGQAQQVFPQAQSNQQFNPGMAQDPFANAQGQTFFIPAQPQVQQPQYQQPQYPQPQVQQPQQLTTLNRDGNLTTVTRNGQMTTVMGQMVKEPGIDRPGSDYRNFDLLDNDGPDACQRNCEADARVCRAFTFVRAGVQGARPRCWLKTEIPPGNASDCCDSGYMQAPDPRALERALFGR